MRTVSCECVNFCPSGSGIGDCLIQFCARHDAFSIRLSVIASSLNRLHDRLLYFSTPKLSNPDGLHQARRSVGFRPQEDHGLPQPAFPNAAKEVPLSEWCLRHRRLHYGSLTAARWIPNRAHVVYTQVNEIAERRKADDLLGDRL